MNKSERGLWIAISLLITLYVFGLAVSARLDLKLEDQGLSPLHADAVAALVPCLVYVILMLPILLTHKRESKSSDSQGADARPK